MRYVPIMQLSQKIIALGLVVNSLAIAGDPYHESLERERQFKQRVSAYNPIKNPLDRYLEHYIHSITMYRLGDDTNIPIAKDLNFEKILDILSKSVSPKISSTQKTILEWEGNDAAGSDFGRMNEKANGTQEASSAELKWSDKTLRISPIYNPASFFNYEDELDGLRYVSLYAEVGREVGPFWNSKMGYLSFNLKLVEHPVTKEIVVVTNNMGLHCNNCEPDIVKSFTFTETELVVEVQTAFWDKQATGTALRHSKRKLVVKLNGSLDLRVYSTRSSDSLNEEKPYFEYFYATGGSPTFK